MDDDKVKPIGVRFKAPPSENSPTLVLVDTRLSGSECNHRNHWIKGGDALGMRLVDVQYLIRDGETEVECGNCGTKLDPMFVLRILANLENQWNRTRLRYLDEMARLAKRQRTQCRHCGKMTDISRK